MMSVPAINSVLPPSGNQPAKINSSTTASSSVSPLAISVPPKLSIIPAAQIPTSPSKPQIGVNHSQVPLSLVYENKVSSQGQSSITKSPEKPKDLSPSKPTSNGVEATTQKAQPNSPSSQPTTQNSKPEENWEQENTTNHAKERIPTTNSSAPGNEEPEQNSTQVQSPAGENTKSPNAKVEEAKAETSESETKEKKESSENVTLEKEKVEEKTTPQAQGTKRKRERKVEEKKSEELKPEKKTRRIRSQVLPYQSPLPELEFFNKSLKEKDASQKSNEDKLIVFYKNEFLAVRNAENGFYLCQTLQNVYRTSHRIRIRWLSQKKEGCGDEGDIYAPDFYDLTDFECILTTVALNKMEKNMYKLRKAELERIENILKRALDVEKGVAEKPSITEEHPDGIDLSLYKDESQLQKAKKAPKRKASSSPPAKSPKQTRSSGPVEPPAKVQPPTPAARKKSKPKTVKKSISKKLKGKKRKSEPSKTKAMDQLKVSPPNEKARVVAKVLRKVDIVPVKEVPVKEMPVKRAKSKAAKRSQPGSRSQKPQKGGKKANQEAGRDEGAQSHHERRQMRTKYSNNKNKK